RSVAIAGFDGGRVARTGGLMGGADKVFTNALMTSDALLVGLLAGTTVARVSEFDGSTLRINGPSIGAYSIWMLGGFSTDASFKVDLFHIDQTAVDVGSARFALTNYSIAFNVNRRFDVSGWWMEPTVGILDTRTVWNDAGHARGHSDSNAFRLQGGSRFGTS